MKFKIEEYCSMVDRAIANKSYSLLKYLNWLSYQENNGYIGKFWGSEEIPTFVLIELNGKIHPGRIRTTGEIYEEWDLRGIPEFQEA